MKDMPGTDWFGMPPGVVVTTTVSCVRCACFGSIRTSCRGALNVLVERYPALSITTCLAASLASCSCSSVCRFEFAAALRWPTTSHCVDSDVSSVANWDGSPRRALVTI